MAKKNSQLLSTRVGNALNQLDSVESMKELLKDLEGYIIKLENQIESLELEIYRLKENK